MDALVFNRPARSKNVIYTCGSQPFLSRRCPMSDRVCPMAFILFASFSSVLVWVFAMMQHLPIR